MSRRRSAFSGEGEKRKVVVGGERKEGEEKRKREREREKLYSFSRWRQKHPCFFFSFREEKSKEIKNSSSSFLPSFFNSREE